MSVRLEKLFAKIEKLQMVKYIEDGNYTDKQKEKLKLEGNNIDGSLVYSYQNSKQAQLVAEYRNNNMAGVYRLQREILENKILRICAIKRVTSNKGGGTPGVDGETWKKPGQRIAAVYGLGEGNKNKDTYKAKPVLRKGIPKPGTNEIRPLGIPTIKDRAAQCIYYYIMDPIVEENSDYNNYGFRKNRAPSQAIQRLGHVLNKSVSSVGIYDADISKCFDRIDHNALLNLCVVENKAPLVKGLKAGVYDPTTGKHIKTTEGLYFDVKPNQIGTPQGGVISPILCNVALNGLEKAIIIEKEHGSYREDPNNKVHLVRYADDFVIIAPTKTALKLRIEKAREFLRTRGLEISPTKSKITTIYEGFDFLGFNIKKIKHKHQIQKHKKQHKHYKDVGNEGYTLLITPTKKNIVRIKEGLTECFKYKGTKTNEENVLINLIGKVNPIVIGGRNYYSVSYASIGTFQKLDKGLLITKVLPGLRKLHRSKTGIANTKEILQKYRKPTRNGKWRIGVKTEEKEKTHYFQRLYEPETHNQQSILKKRTLPSQNPKAKGYGTDINPYTESGREGWQKRTTGTGYFEADKLEYGSVYKHAVVKYRNRCGLCKHPLGQDAELIELHRIKPGTIGGKYTYKNVIPVHKFCHIKHHANAAKETERFDTSRYSHIINLKIPWTEKRELLSLPLKQAYTIQPE